MSDTPRTDEAVNGLNPFLPPKQIAALENLARTLERELKRRVDLGAENADLRQRKAELERTLAQRDRAMEQLVADHEGMCRELAEARETIRKEAGLKIYNASLADQYLRERDEARSAYASPTVQTALRDASCAEQLRKALRHAREKLTDISDRYVDDIDAIDDEDGIARIPNAASCTVTDCDTAIALIDAALKEEQ